MIQDRHGRTWKYELEKYDHDHMLQIKSGIALATYLYCLRIRNWDSTYVPPDYDRYAMLERTGKLEAGILKKDINRWDIIIQLSEDQGDVLMIDIPEKELCLMKMLIERHIETSSSLEEQCVIAELINNDQTSTPNRRWNDCI